MNWSHLVRNCILKHVNEEKMEGRLEVTERRGSRRRKLLNDLKKKEDTGNSIQGTGAHSVENALWKSLWT